MFSLQEFMGRDPKFFDLFEEAARQAYACAKAAKALGTNSQSTDALGTMHLVRQSRTRCKELTEEVSELAVKSFVTVLDREDIETLAGAIYRISKPLEKFAERLEISREVFQSTRAFHQLETIEHAAQTVLLMIKSIRRGMNAELVQRLNGRLQAMEAEADTLELELLKDLYRNTRNPVEVIATQDLFDLAEKAIDRCRDAGNVILHICHKNS